MPRIKLRGMYIAKKALKNQFDPRNFQPETYLLCKLQWGDSDKFWIHWARNPDNDFHVEEYFLEEIFEARSSRICRITWYLSWSPCEDCCHEILDFLQHHRNVYIDIRVARLYYIDDEEKRVALRALGSSSRVTIRVMEIEDYEYCWRTFIQSHVYDDSWPRNFQRVIARNRWMLHSVLAGLY